MKTTLAIYLGEPSLSSIRRAQHIKRYFPGTTEIIKGPKSIAHLSYIDAPAAAYRGEELSPAEERRLIYRWLIKSAPRLLIIDQSRAAAEAAQDVQLPYMCFRRPEWKEELKQQHFLFPCTNFIAPFPEELESPLTPNWIRNKTLYTGCINDNEQPQNKRKLRQDCQLAPAKQYALIYDSFSSNHYPLHFMNVLSEELPDWNWLMIHQLMDDRFHIGDKLEVIGCGNKLDPYLQAADVVVCNADPACVQRLAQSNAKILCIPERDAHSAQLYMARVLQRAGTAVVCAQRPGLTDWKSLLRQVQQLPDCPWNSMLQKERFQRLMSRIRSICGTPKKRDTQVQAVPQKRSID